MSDVIPIFKSHYSVGKSILTLELPKDCKQDGSDSIISIAKDNGLKELYLVEDSFAGFIEAHNNCEQSGISLMFGVRFTVCADILKKDEESLATEHKCIVWMLNSAGYKDLCKLYSRSWIEGQYYINRIDYSLLNEMWTDNLSLSYPFYDSFLAKNLLTLANIVPNDTNLPRNFFIESHSLPFDGLIKEAVQNYAKDHSIINTHSIYYKDQKSFKSFNVYRCIAERTTMDKPNLEHFSSDNFSWEAYKERINNKILERINAKQIRLPS